MRILLTVATLTLLAGPAAAQGAAPRAGLAQPVPSATTRWESSFRRDSVRPNEWKKGALIGGGIGAGFGLLLYAFANSIDDSNRSNVPLLIGPILIFALVGGMIGSGSHR